MSILLLPIENLIVQRFQTYSDILYYKGAVCGRYTLQIGGFLHHIVLAGTCFGSDTPKIADYMIWPWVERIQVLPRLYNDQVPISDESFPRIRAWYVAMQRQPINQEIQTDIHSFCKLLIQYKQDGTVSYDEIQLLQWQQLRNLLIHRRVRIKNSLHTVK